MSNLLHGFNRDSAFADEDNELFPKARSSSSSDDSDETDYEHDDAGELIGDDSFVFSLTFKRINEASFEKIATDLTLRTLIIEYDAVYLNDNITFLGTGAEYKKAKGEY